MGVKGLWQLLDPTGRPVTLESLEGKVLAIDVSIWLNQTVKGMRDAHGNPLPNAHLLGLFNRVCKLLFYRIKPVFVFDGGVPFLKKQTLAARRQKKQDALLDSEKTTQKMLQNLIKHHALRTVLGKDDQNKLKPQVSSNVTRPVGTDAYMYQLPPSPERTRDDDDTADGELGDWEQRMEQRNFIYEQFQSLEDIDLESAEFKDLPPEIQHEILTDVKEKRKYEVQSRRQTLPEDSQDFSNFQLKKLMKQSKLSQKIDGVVKELNSQGVGDVAQSITGEQRAEYVESRRVVSEDSSHYILIKGLNKLDHQEKMNFAHRAHSLATLPSDDAKPGSSGVSRSEEKAASQLASLINMSSNIVEEAKSEKPSNSANVKQSQSSLIDDDGEDAVTTPTKIYNSKSEIRAPWSGHKTGVVLDTGYISEEGDDDEDDCVITGAETFSAKVAKLMQERAEKKNKGNGMIDGKDVIVIKDEKKDSKQKPKSTRDSCVMDEVPAKVVSDSDGDCVIKSDPETQPKVEMIKDEICVEEISDGEDTNKATKEDSSMKDGVSNSSPQNNGSAVKESDISCSNEGGFFREDSDEDEETEQVSVPDTAAKSTNNSQITENKNLIVVQKQTVPPVISRPPTSSQKEQKEQDSKSCAEREQVSAALSSESAPEAVVTGPVTSARSLNGDTSKGAIKPTVPSATKEADSICISEDEEEKSSDSDDDFMEVKSQSGAGSEAESASDDGEYPANILISDEEPIVDSPPHVVADDDEITAGIEDGGISPRIEDDSQPETRSEESRGVDMDEEIARHIASQPEEEVNAREESTVEPISQEEMLEMQSALTVENRELMKEQARQQRIAATVTEQMSVEAQELLALFGVPFLVSPMEAEAQCAQLNLSKLTQGTITDDSDIWLFGGELVYKNFFNQNKQVELYRAPDIKSQLLLDREAMINVALLCGSDYTDGVEGVGPVGAMEILGEFPGKGLELLKKMKDWWDVAQTLPRGAVMTKTKSKLRYLTLTSGFPSHNVVEAYLKPTVDDSDERFSWSLPDLDLLREYSREKFGWSKERTDELLLPVMKNLNKNQTQQSITSYFLPPAIGEPKGLKSKRVKHILQRMRIRNDHPEMPSNSSAPSPKKSPVSSPQKPVNKTPERPTTRGTRRGQRGSPRGIGRTAATVRTAAVIDVDLSESSSDDEEDGARGKVKKVTNQASKRPARGRGSRARGKQSRR